jgi:hypothetical protein
MRMLRGLVVLGKFDGVPLELSYTDERKKYPVAPCVRLLRLWCWFSERPRS